MLLSKRKFASLSRTTNRLVYSRPYGEYYAEREMGEAERFTSNIVGHPFLNLYQSSLYRYISLTPYTYRINIMPGLIYLVIAPLILLFSSVIFGLFWVVFRYNLLYITISRPNIRGLLYPIALNQLFTGVYVIELCIIGLFFLVRDDYNRVICVGQAIIIIITTAITLGFQLLLNNAFAPLLRFLPQTKVGEAAEEPKYHRTGTNSYFGILIWQCSKWLAPTKNPSFIDGTFAGI